MLTRNYRCVHRYTCLSAAPLVRLFEFGTRYTEGKPHVDAIKDGGRRRGSFLKTFLRWTFFEMKSLNLRDFFFFFFQAFFQINTCRVSVYNYPFNRLFIAYVTNKVIIRRWRIQLALWKFSCMVDMVAQYQAMIRISSVHIVRLNHK